MIAAPQGFLPPIEDTAALDHMNTIAAQPDVDVLFVRPADLSLSLGSAAASPQMDAALDRMIAAARNAGKVAEVYVGTDAQIKPMAAPGISVFVGGSEYGFLLNTACQMMRVGLGGIEAGHEHPSDCRVNAGLENQSRRGRAESVLGAGATIALHRLQP